MLLVHGMAEHSARHEHVGCALSERGIDVLSFDLLVLSAPALDALRHECPNEPERDEVVADLAAWLDERRGDP
jgi:alpha-beta hydrolase superfamily lysophospholipase